MLTSHQHHAHIPDPGVPATSTNMQPSQLGPTTAASVPSTLTLDALLESIDIDADTGDHPPIDFFADDDIADTTPNDLRQLAVLPIASEAASKSTSEAQFGSFTQPFTQEPDTGRWSLPSRPTLHDFQLAITQARPTTLQLIFSNSDFSTEQLRTGLCLAYSTLQQAMAKSARLRSKLEEDAAVRLDGIFDVPGDVAKRTMSHLVAKAQEVEKEIKTMQDRLAVNQRAVAAHAKEHEELEETLTRVVEAIALVCWLVMLAGLYSMCREV